MKSCKRFKDNYTKSKNKYSEYISNTNNYFKHDSKLRYRQNNKLSFNSKIEQEEFNKSIYFDNWSLVLYFTLLYLVVYLIIFNSLYTCNEILYNKYDNTKFNVLHNYNLNNSTYFNFNKFNLFFLVLIITFIFTYHNLTLTNKKIIIRLCFLLICILKIYNYLGSNCELYFNNIKEQLNHNIINQCNNINLLNNRFNFINNKELIYYNVFKYSNQSINKTINCNNNNSTINYKFINENKYENNKIIFTEKELLKLSISIKEVLLLNIVNILINTTLKLKYHISIIFIIIEHITLLYFLTTHNFQNYTIIIEIIYCFFSINFIKIIINFVISLIIQYYSTRFATEIWVLYDSFKRSYNLTIKEVDKNTIPLFLISKRNKNILYRNASAIIFCNKINCNKKKYLKSNNNNNIKNISKDLQINLMDLFINFKDESNLEYFNKNLYKIDNEKNYVVNFNFLFLEEINNDNVGYDINNNYKIYNIDTSSKKLLYKECIYFNANFNKISNLVKTTGDVKFCKHIWSDITIKSDHYKNQEVYVLRFNTNNNLNESITLDNNIESLNNYLFSVIEDVDAFVCMINKLEYEIEEILKYKPKLINKLAFNSNYNSPALKKHIVNNNSYYTPSFIDKKINNIDDSAKTVRYTKRKNINPVYMVLNLINNGGNINYILNDLIRELQSCIPKTSYVISFYFYYVTNYIYVKANSYNILDKNINKIDLLSNIINKNRTNLKNLLQYSTYIDNNNFSNMDSNINLLCAKNTNNIDYNKIALKYTINFENIKYNNSVSSIYINDKIEKNLNFNDKYKKYQNPKISLNKTNDLDYDLIDSETDSNFLSKYYTLNKNFTTKSSNNSASKILITKTKNSPIKNTKTKYLLIKNKSNKKNSSFKPKINIFYKKNKPLYTEINKLINIQTLYDIDVKLKYNYKTINIKVLFEEYLQILKILSAKKNIFLSLNVSFDENVIVEKTKVDVVFLTIINFIINNNNICLLEKDSSYNYSKNSAKSLNNLNYTSFNKECRKTLFIKIYKEYIKNSSNVNKIKSNSKNIINEYQINVSIKFNDDDAILAYKNINELLFFYYSSFYFSSLDTSYINDLKYKNLDVNLEKNNYYLSIVEKLNYLHKDLLVAINIIKTWDKSFDIILCHNQCNGKSNNNLQKYKNLVEIKFGIPFLQIYNNNFKMNSFYKLPSIKQSEEHLNNIIINIFKNEFFKTSIIAKEDTCLKNKIEIYDVNADYCKLYLIYLI